MECIYIPVDGPPRRQEIGEDEYRYLARVFPDSFDGIRLAPDVYAYVGDTSLLDRSVPNPAGKALCDAVYQQAAGRPYHTDIRGPLVVLGMSRSGAAKDVPEPFIARHLPGLAPLGAQALAEMRFDTDAARALAEIERLHERMREMREDR